MSTGAVAVTPAEVTIGRLRVHGSGDPMATRLAADRVLAGADLRPAGLSPAAVLVVDRLADPLPGRIDLRAFRADAGWQGRTRSVLADCAARAARPAADPVPAGANAVLFADRAELLSCLLLDAALGLLAARWWWRALGLVDSDAAWRAAALTPEALPAVFARLAELGSVTRVASQASSRTAAGLITAMAAAHGAAALAQVLPPNPVAEDAHLGDELNIGASPWSSCAPAEATQLARLPPVQEALTGLALLLAADPAAVRRPALRARLARWTAGRVAGPMMLTREPRTPRLPASPPSTRRADRTGAGPDPEPVAPPAAAPDVMATTDRPADRTAAWNGLDAAPGHKHARSTTTTTTTTTGEGPLALAGAAVSKARPASPQKQTIRRSASETDVETALGGLFHIVHLAQQLGLYGDFTAPGRPGISLGVWDFVALVGRRLLGRSARSTDPVWQLLADLQGRAYDQQPGIGFRPPRVWRASPAWLRPFPTAAPWPQAALDGRLVLGHPSGFVVVDGRADLRRELARYQVARTRPWRGGLPGGGWSARQRWVAHLAGFLRCRLVLALGVPPARAAGLAMVRPARVTVTRSRVDVVSDLADLPIEVRLAAVDRDPGFVPVAGRALYFHFR